MYHFPQLAQFRSRAVRHGLILLHLPVILFAVATHAVGGVITHTCNLAVAMLNAYSAAVQGLMHHLVTGVAAAVSEVRTVALGGAEVDEVIKRIKLDAE
jgi:hypothetical protein